MKSSHGIALGFVLLLAIAFETLTAAQNTARNK